MSRACPTCGRTWGPDATFCGACGTLLEPAPPHPADTGPPSAGRGRRGTLVVLTALSLAAAAVLAVPRVSFPSLGSGDVDDEVEIPTAVDGVEPTTRARDEPVRCVARESPTACIQWQVETRGRQPLGPRLPGVGLLVGSGRGGLQVREIDTGQVRWSRDDLPEMWPLGVVDDVVVARTRSLTQGFDARDGRELWAKTGLRPVGLPLRLDPPAVLMGRGDGDGTTALVALEPRGGDARWEWVPPWEGNVTSVTSTSPTAILVAGSGQLARIDAATGTTVWTVPTVDEAYLQAHPPGHVAAQALEQGPGSAPLVVHDATSGAVLQRLSEGGPVMSHLVIEGVIVVHRPTEQTVDGISMDTGERVWRHELRTSGALGFPVDRTARGPVVVMDDDATRVRRLDPATGEPRWRVDLPASPRATNNNAFLGQPMLVDDHVVVEDPSSVVTVLDLATGGQRVRVDGGRELDVRSLDPLTLVRGDQWMRIDVRDPADVDQ